MCREAGSYCAATRIIDPPMANAVLVPGKQQRIYTDDQLVALAHPHAETLRETARQHGVEVVGELVPCAGCSEAKGRRMPVPRSINSRSTKPLLFYSRIKTKPRQKQFFTTWGRILHLGVRASHTQRPPPQPANLCRPQPGPTH